MSGKKTTAKKADRKKRIPFGVPHRKLAFTGRQGYKRRVINDVGDRINRALEGGYTLVEKEGAKFLDPDTSNRNDSLNNSVSKTVNSDGTKGYLMEIPIAYYAADQKAKQDRINQTEDALRVGADAHGKPGKQGRYVPKEGIKIG